MLRVTNATDNLHLHLQRKACFETRYRNLLLVLLKSSLNAANGGIVFTSQIREKLFNCIYV